MDGMDRSRAMAVRTRVAIVAAAAAVLTLPATLAGTASAQTQPVFVNGQAQVVPAFNVSAQWVRQRLWVETEFDSDGDGKRDRMHVDVTRPAQTDSREPEGAGGLRDEPVLRGHGEHGLAVLLEHQPGGRRGAAAAPLAAGDRAGIRTGPRSRPAK